MADVKSAKHTVTNVSDGPKVVNTLIGGTILQAGESAEVEMSEAEATSAIVTEWFEFGKAKPAKAAE